MVCDVLFVLVNDSWQSLLSKPLKSFDWGVPRYGSTLFSQCQKPHAQMKWHLNFTVNKYLGDTEHLWKSKNILSILVVVAKGAGWVAFTLPKSLVCPGVEAHPYSFLFFSPKLLSNVLFVTQCLSFKSLSFLFSSAFSLCCLDCAAVSTLGKCCVTSTKDCLCFLSTVSSHLAMFHFKCFVSRSPATIAIDLK